MKAFLRILSLFQVLVCVEMMSQSGNVFTGTEGDRVEIYSNYPDGYQFVSHYFCRHPCGYSDVLIRTKKAGKVTSEGRYSILNTVSAQSLSVTIRNLRLGDSGVYYCGVEKWGKDRLSKVEVTVRKETAGFGSDMPASPRVASSTDSVSQAELVVFGVLSGVSCAMLAVVLFFLYQDLSLRSSAACTCSSVI